MRNSINLILCWIGIHRWKNRIRSSLVSLVIGKNNGNRYYECLRCGKRKVVLCDKGYQPIDSSWLNGGKT